MKKPTESRKATSLKPRKESKALPLPATLLQIFEEHRGDLFKTNEISKMVGIKSDDPKYQLLRDTLRELEESGAIIRGSRRRFGIPSRAENLIEGIIHFQPTGNGLLLPDAEHELGDTVLIRSRNLHTSQHGDRVRVALFAAKRGERPQGEITEVLERATAPVVGRLEITQDKFVVRADNAAFQREIQVPKKELRGEKAGDKVSVRLDEWKDERREPEGKVTGVLGAAGSVKAEMQAIAIEYELPREFPPFVLKAAEALPTEIPESEIAKRIDLRKETVFTIDPEDAKDFDDAVSLKEHGDGTVTLGVHIADVSHYVTEGSVLDDEALDRGTSVYLVGGVIPMLPERISNELCSLRPDEDKLTFSAFLTIEEETGKILAMEFGKSIIRSVMRFTYEEAEKRIKSGRGKYSAVLKKMRTLSEKMYELRHSEGSIDFETDEVRFRFDEKGEPVESYKKERLGSMRMVEDFMLAANRAVAGVVAKEAKQGSERPFLYRIHADPDPGKLRDLANLARALGYRLSAENPRPKTVQKFLDSVKGKPEEKLLNQLMLRSMAKAIYAEHNVGHFGLAFLHYTHFTSPIRRYPDLIVHRMLFEYLSKTGMSREREHHYFKILPSIADQTSALERRATDAERASIKVAQMLLMRQHVGEEFVGRITGVTHFGFFVELESGAEGLVHIRELPGFYTFDEAHYTLTRERRQSPREHGQRQRRKPDNRTLQSYSLGDEVRVLLIRVNEEKRALDFKLAEE